MVNRGPWNRARVVARTGTCPSLAHIRMEHLGQSHWSFRAAAPGTNEGKPLTAAKLTRTTDRAT